MRKKLPNYKVQFEHNTKFFGIVGTLKHEIDIVVFNEQERYAIELKYPVNGQYPEQLHKNGFDATFCLTMVNDRNFYSGKKIDGIYAYFRGNKTLSGKINKPTGVSYDSIMLDKSYNIVWKGNTENLKYYLIDIRE